MAGVSQAGRAFGTEFMEAWITEVDLSERPFQLYTETANDLDGDVDHRFRRFGKVARHSG